MRCIIEDTERGQHVNNAEHEEMPQPPDPEDSTSSKTGAEHLDKGIKDKLVNEKTDTNQMIVKGMLFDCHQVLPPFWNIVHLLLTTCSVLKESNGGHVQ